MYKILHIFQIGKFANDNVKFINENFSDNYHEFWIYGQRDSQVKFNIFCHKNIKYVKNITKKLGTKKIYEFDKIIFHGVFNINIISFFAKDKKLLKKLYLYFWGGDKFYIKGNKWDNLKKKYVVRNAKGIINILPEEQHFMQKFYHPKGKLFCARYYADNHLMKQIKDQKDNKKEYVAIQVGHSAKRTNDHVNILQLLYRFKDENIKIYAPLSYGDKDYAEKVIEVGKKLFGGKFIALTEFLNEDEYNIFLKHMDIGIFPMNRQQALGNIQTLLYFGKKVYLRDKSVLWHYFKIMNKCDIFAVHKLYKMEYCEFIDFSETSKKNNANVLERLLRMEPRIEAWDKIFND